MCLQGWDEDRSKKKGSELICRIPEINITLERTAADLASGPVEHSARIVRSICERFNLTESLHISLEKTIKNYLAKKFPT